MLPIAFPRNTALANSFIILMGAIGVLYIGEDVILPFVIAGILTIVLLPSVFFLVKLKIPRAIAIFVAVITALGIVLLTGSLIARTSMQIISDLPRYEESLTQKAEALKSVAAGSAYSNAAKVIQKLQDDIGVAPNADVGSKSPTQIIAADNPYNGPSRVSSIFSTVAHPFLQLATIFVLLTFMLFYHEELRDRLILLGGSYDLRRTTMAVNDTSKRLSRLMLGILSINLTVGAVIGSALWMLGVPGAVMWGLLTAMLRFVPFVGTFIASAFPILTALAVGDGWALVVIVAAIIVITEFLAAQVLEPVVIGKMSGLWPPALIAAALFWVAVWGPVGLVVSTPITICMLALSQHIRAWRPVSVLLGDGSVLAPEDSFYGRMIVGDVAGVAVLMSRIKEDPEIYLRDVVVPAIQRVSHDMEQGGVDREQQHDIKDTLQEALEILVPDDMSSEHRAPDVLVVPAHGVVNYSAALAFSAFLRLKGISNSVSRLGEVTPSAGPVRGSTRQVAVLSLAPLQKRVSLLTLRRVKSRMARAAVTEISWINQAGDVTPPLEYAEMIANLPRPGSRKEKPGAPSHMQRARPHNPLVSAQTFKRA